LPRSISTKSHQRPFGRLKPLPQGDMVFGFFLSIIDVTIVFLATDFQRTIEAMFGCADAKSQIGVRSEKLGT